VAVRYHSVKLKAVLIFAHAGTHGPAKPGGAGSKASNSAPVKYRGVRQRPWGKFAAEIRDPSKVVSAPVSQEEYIDCNGRCQSPCLALVVAGV
jgi:hypothetical protein